MIVEQGLRWHGHRDGFYVGRYFIQKPQRFRVRPRHGWQAWRTNTVEHGKLLPPADLGNWPTFATAAAACELDAVLERTC